MLGIAAAAGAAEPEWTNIGPADQAISALAVVLADHPNRSPARVILYAGTPESGILRSPDHGATWIAVNHGLTNLGILSFAIHQSEVPSQAPITRYETVIYARTSSAVFRSADSGASWTAVNADLGVSPPGPYTVNALAVDPAGGVYISTGYGAFKSANRGDSWVSINQGTRGGPANAFAVDPKTPVTLYGNLGHRLVKSVSGGEDWTDILPRPLGGWGFSADRVFVDPFSATVYVPGAIDISPFQGLFEFIQYRSRDNGESWTSFREFGDIRDVAFLDESTTFAVGSYRGPSGSESGVFWSTDGGATWQPTNAGFPISQTFSVSTLAPDPVSPGTVYAATTQGVFRSGPAPASGLPRVVPKRQNLSSPVADR